MSFGVGASKTRFGDFVLVDLRTEITAWQIFGSI